MTLDKNEDEIERLKNKYKKESFAEKNDSTESYDYNNNKNIFSPIRKGQKDASGQMLPEYPSLHRSSSVY